MRVWTTLLNLKKQKQNNREYKNAKFDEFIPHRPPQAGKNEDLDIHTVYVEGRVGGQQKVSYLSKCFNFS